MQLRYWGAEGPGKDEGLREGDVLLSNHPQLAGGSHLPDITVMTPVFDHGEVSGSHPGCQRCVASCCYGDSVIHWSAKLHDWLFDSTKPTQPLSQIKVSAKFSHQSLGSEVEPAVPCELAFNHMQCSYARSSRHSPC